MLACLGRSRTASVVAAVVVVGVVCLPGGASGAPGAKVAVKNTHDSGPGSLREAITNAVDGETIEVPAGHFSLTSGELSTALSLQIVGAGARKTIIDGSGTSRILEDTSTTSSLSLSNLTVENGNSQGGDGGGIEAAGALTLVGVAVVGNRAGAIHAEGNGGGVEVFGKLVVRSSLIAHNYGYSGGGVEAETTLELINSTVADNQAGSSGNPASQTNCDGPDLPRYMSAGYNLGGTVDCGLTQPSDQQKVNPRLGKLQNNGGPTNTLAIGTKSPAIDRIPLAKCPKLDQRGKHRPDQHEQKCDIGAYEHQDQ